MAEYIDRKKAFDAVFAQFAYINGFDSEPIRLYPNNYGAWLDWLRQEVQT